jgi:hypothetical protein
MLANRIRGVIRKFGGGHGVVYHKAPMVADQL